jgi:hypothetical protein
MKNKGSHRERTFSPLRDKTLANVLRHLFVTEFGFETKVIFAEAMIERILETIDAFVKPASLLSPGQMLWMAVTNDGKKHTFKRMKEIPQVPVILDLVTDEELQAIADGKDFAALRRQRHARLLEQTYDQQGALAHTDLCVITLTNESQVSSDIDHVQQDRGRLLPYRGTVHDVGPTLSHKAEVARLLEAGYLEPEIGRKLSPVHNLRSVERYAQTYKNATKLLERGFTPGEISGILSISKRLVETYIAIVNEHHPEIIAENQHLQDHTFDTSQDTTLGAK